MEELSFTQVIIGTTTFAFLIYFSYFIEKLKTDILEMENFGEIFIDTYDQINLS